MATTGGGTVTSIVASAAVAGAAIVAIGLRRLFHRDLTRKAAIVAIKHGERFVDYLVNEVGLELTVEEEDAMEAAAGGQLRIGRQLAYMVHRIKADIGISEFTQAQFMVVNHLVRQAMREKNMRLAHITRYHVLVTAAVMLPTPSELAQLKALQGPTFQLANSVRKDDTQVTWLDVLHGDATRAQRELGTGPVLPAK